MEIVARANARSGKPKEGGVRLALALGAFQRKLGAAWYGALVGDPDIYLFRHHERSSFHRRPDTSGKRASGSGHSETATAAIRFTQSDCTRRKDRADQSRFRAQPGARRHAWRAPL